MAITEAQVKRVKYPPEKIPDSWYGTVPNLAEVAPPIVNLKRFTPYIITLDDIKLVPNVNVELRARYDDNNVQSNTGAFLSTVIGTGQVGAWKLPARDILTYTLFGLAPGILNFPTFYGLWVEYPTVAHKLFYGIPLTADEQELNKKLGISDTVEKGLLPLPISQQIEREYHITGEETHTRVVNIVAGNTLYPIENLYPRPNEFLVLTRIAAAPGLAAENITINIGRDGDNNLASVATFALSPVDGGEISCFIPAIRELSLQTGANIPVGIPEAFRYTFQRVRWSNILRVRFGQVSRDEVPGDLFDKVLGGIN